MSRLPGSSYGSASFTPSRWAGPIRSAQYSRRVLAVALLDTPPGHSGPPSCKSRQKWNFVSASWRPCKCGEFWNSTSSANLWRSLRWLVRGWTHRQRAVPEAPSPMFLSVADRPRPLCKFVSKPDCAGPPSYCTTWPEHWRWHRRGCSGGLCAKGH